VKLGERDSRSGEYPVLDGLSAGDRVLRSPGGQLVDGQRFESAKGLADGTAPKGTAASGGMN
jgi:membrane fusion protein, multidrug efflux system